MNRYQDLFDHLNRYHNLVLTQSEMQDIVSLALNHAVDDIASKMPDDATTIEIHINKRAQWVESQGWTVQSNAAYLKTVSEKVSWFVELANKTKEHTEIEDE